MKHRKLTRYIGFATGLAIHVSTAADLSAPLQNVGTYIEPSNTTFMSTLDGRNPANGVQENLTPRSVNIRLGDNRWFGFDTDLLRMNALWVGGFAGDGSMARTSYQLPGKKTPSGQSNLRRIDGDVWLSTSQAPGWSIDTFSTHDPRQVNASPKEAGRGPLPVEYGRWNGFYRVGDQTVLSYQVSGTTLLESHSWTDGKNTSTFTRYFEAPQGLNHDLYLKVAQLHASQTARISEDTLQVLSKEPSNQSFILSARTERGEPIPVQRTDDDWIMIQIPQGVQAPRVALSVQRSEATSKNPNAELIPPDFESLGELTARLQSGGSSQWPERIETSISQSEDATAYVIDAIELPFPNPWNRNVRPADLAFFSDGRAAMATFEGDIWMASGFDAPSVRWSRFATGFSEPMGIAIRDDELFVYSRAGLTKLTDYDGDGEADYYKNFCDLPIQSAETREFPMDLQLRADGGFYLAKGGIHSGPEAAHNGAILHISPDGRSIEMVADGLREPFLGLRPDTDFLTASDQQGNHVPATPIYHIDRDRFYGFEPANHKKNSSAPPDPITWIPHLADNSGAGQFWIQSTTYGPLSHSMMHMSYGRPALFTVFVQDTPAGPQGGVAQLDTDVSFPLLKSARRPTDGAVFLLGFQIYGSNARDLAGLGRLRYTGQKLQSPIRFSIYKNGLLATFATDLPTEAATDLNSYRLQRWNYKRTSNYGSPHYKLDGGEGQDDVGIRGVAISEDGKTLFIATEEIIDCDQMALSVNLQSAPGEGVQSTIYFSPRVVEPYSPNASRFPETSFEALEKREPVIAQRGQEAVSAAHGKEIAFTYGCLACHSTDGSELGRTGPTWKGLIGKTRDLQGNRELVADLEYIRRAITNPGKERVLGFEAGMPSYAGILSPSQIESLILFIASLSETK